MKSAKNSVTTVMRSVGRLSLMRSVVMPFHLVRRQDLTAGGANNQKGGHIFKILY